MTKPELDQIRKDLESVHSNLVGHERAIWGTIHPTLSTITDSLNKIEQRLEAVENQSTAAAQDDAWLTYACRKLYEENQQLKKELNRKENDNG